jgi:hypothetical protein
VAPLEAASHRFNFLKCALSTAEKYRGDAECHVVSLSNSVFFFHVHSSNDSHNSKNFLSLGTRAHEGHAQHFLLTNIQISV